MFDILKSVWYLTYHPQDLKFQYDSWFKSIQAKIPDLSMWYGELNIDLVEYSTQLKVVEYSITIALHDQ